MAASEFPPQTLIVGPYTFTISEATNEDIPDFVDTFDVVFANNLLFKIMRGTGDPALLRERNIKHWTGQFGMSGRRHFKVVDEGTGKIAGITRWWFPHVLTAQEQAAMEEAKKAPQEPVPGSNSRVQEEFERQLVGKREKWVKIDDMYLMNILGVVPEYQRLGLGAALLAPVLRLADKEGRRTYIEPTPEGEGLYRKFGWEEIGDTIRIDFAEYGAEGKINIRLMMREPGTGMPL